MKNPVKVDLPNGRIVITRKFAEQAKTIGTPEFKYLQEIRMVHPDLEIVQRTIEKNESKKTYTCKLLSGHRILACSNLAVSTIAKRTPMCSTLTLPAL